MTDDETESADPQLKLAADYKAVLDSKSQKGAGTLGGYDAQWTKTDGGIQATFEDGTVSR